MPDLLIEIGVEEIPADVIVPALEQMRVALDEGLTALRLTHGEARVYGTPRRLAAIVADVAERQPDEVKEIKGPPASAAFGEDRQPTKAAQGFAAKNGLSVDELRVEETDKGAFVFATVTEQGRPAAEVIPGLLEGMMTGFVFPKTLKWGDLEERFARPVRWLVALLGDTVLDWEFARVKAGRTTRGHRFLGSDDIEIASPAAYLETLRGQHVIADHHERREVIRERAIAAAAAVQGRPRLDEDLLEENNFLVEWPSCILGSYPERFRELPEAVPVTIMQKHQRYFPVEDAQGRLLPYFIITRNGEGPGEEMIRRGNEKVIVPRLEDGEFYLTEDLKTPLPDRLDALKRVTFMESLGTLYDKTERIVRLVAWLAEALEAPAEEREMAARAALLSKCDQVTLMVGDGKLAALQGIIGGHYAGLAGEAPEVCAAIAEQYLPIRPDDPAPASLAGKLLALADKLDNLAAAFALGMIPKGTRDPQGLRRQAQAVLALLQAGDFHLPLCALVGEAVDLIPVADPRPKGALASDEAAAALMDFMAARLDATLQEDGVPYDTVRAALGGRWSDPVEVINRGHALHRIRAESDEFEGLVDTATRPANIWRSTDLPDEVEVQPGLFEDEAEGTLWAALATAREEVARLQQDEPVPYEAIWQIVSGLRGPIDALFEAVMINAGEPALRNNRLAMMRELDTLYLQLADFREIVQ
ncbi:MAG: glycine--tRNA ligase subunit beta [Armatimonadetes bacterium]|nr:glycine--tRNA ligase subunit beta [Armatimonadota bacterium]